MQLVQVMRNVTIRASRAIGFFYISASAGTTCTVVGTFYKIAGTYGTVQSDNFTMSASGTLTYNGIVPASFFLHVSVSMISDTNNVIVGYSPAVNGVVDTRLILTRKVSTLGDVGSLSGAGPFDLSPGDEIEIHVSADSAGAVLTANQMLISIHGT